MNAIEKTMSMFGAKCMQLWTELSCKVSEKKGQATSEYAMILGIIVVVAIVALGLLGGDLSAMWDDITAGFGAV